MTMTTADEIRKTLIELVREQARTREHRISARQLAALETQTMASIRAMSAYLDTRPLRTPAPSPMDIPAQVGRATAAALTASTGDPAVRTDAAQISPYAKAGGAPASRELHAGPVADARPGRRPGPKVTEPGIYYYDKHVYKVIRSQYSGHLQARRLNPAAKQDRWTYIQGMMGLLRAADKMTAENSREYEELYGYPTCTDCGAPLENDLSRRRRVGPVCWDKNGHSDSEIGE
jgi:hypothetical protein